MGTREQNIRQMIQEQNAIRLINEELKLINRSRAHHGTLTEGERKRKRLNQLTASLMTHKAALAEIRRQVNNNTKLGIAAETSMNALAQSLARMRMAYRSLSEEERNSKFGQNLLAEIKKADAEIKTLEASICNHQRNVGNYASGFNGLSMSIQQVIRELPSAAVGLNTFFLAISNNILILIDEIKRMRAVNEGLIKSGQMAVPVWKQVIHSIFSWQSAMVVAITVFSMYGKDIANYVKGLFTVQDAQEEARKEAEAFANAIKKSHEEWRNSVAQTAAQQIASYRKMQREWNALGTNLSEKKKYIETNKTAFNNLGFAVNGVSDAERIMTGNTNAVVQSIMARAKAAAYYAQIQEATERYIKQTEYNRGTVKGGGYFQKFHPKNNQTTEVSELKGLKEGKDFTRQMAGMGANVQLIYTLTDSGIAKVNARREREAARTLAENQKQAKDQLDKQLASLQGGLDAAEKENKALLDTIGVKGYVNDKESKAGKTTGKSKAELQAEYKELLDKQAQERKKKQQEAEFEVRQNEIDMLQESSEKTLKQLELNKDKELAAVTQYEDDLKRAKIQAAKERFKKDTNRNKGSVFDMASVDVSMTSQEQRVASSRINKALSDYAKGLAQLAEKEKSSMNEYLKQYGTMQQQRAAIAAEYDQRIARENNKWVKSTLEEQKKQALSAFDFRQFQDSINWNAVFGDLDKYTKKALRLTLQRIKQWRKSKQFQDFSVTDKKAYVEAQGRLEKATGGNVFSDFSKAMEALQKAQKEFQNAKLIQSIVSKPNSILQTLQGSRRMNVLY
ncbi:hypothetical protein [Prevotella sp. kh1p2]|uniref:hypothetical protein n=1 Tax=Prevotella sp. kh1p2 TaxID=1761883 RepID=UPI0008C3C9AE|nr:hypothetical protein [Prevotella sp. kh1p2]SET22258.1 hypothetical protein SAMN04487825_12152 [Prevotella sp. kh1p2]SNU12294.1 hypothetical protein SAMN06298210_12212 [Prevotellaceae bacterium KH2P17]